MKGGCVGLGGGKGKGRRVKREYESLPLGMAILWCYFVFILLNSIPVSHNVFIASERLFLFFFVCVCATQNPKSPPRFVRLHISHHFSLSSLIRHLKHLTCQLAICFLYQCATLWSSIIFIAASFCWPLTCLKHIFSGFLYSYWVTQSLIIFTLVSVWSARQITLF